MSHPAKSNRQPPTSEAVIVIAACITIGLLIAIEIIGRSFAVTSAEAVAFSPPALSLLTPEAQPQATQTLRASARASTTPVPTKTATSTRLFVGEIAKTRTPTAPSTRLKATPTPVLPSPTATQTSTPRPTPTPTLDLASCNAAGCGPKAIQAPTAESNFNLLLTEKRPTRRACSNCPQNEQLSEAQLDRLVAVDQATLNRLRTIVLSQESYELAPGMVYIVFQNVHHVVIDLKASGYLLRNIIPPIPDERTRAGIRITPSYCFTPESLVVTTADYHGLNGSNKTETGRDIFFHQGRAALFKRDGRFDLDVIRERKAYNRATISWGGGPIFIWNGQYDYNPEQEWFDAKSLAHYRNTRWAKVTAAVSQNRKYLFISLSFGLTLEEHAQNIIDLGRRWDIKVDRAMRFDGSESAYLALRIGDYMVPVLNLEEPLIVNCFAVERSISNAR